MEDTVEKDVVGLAEQIIAEEEETRAQELVCLVSSSTFRIPPDLSL